MKFCSQCGQTIIFQIPANDSRERHVCLSCGVIHYDNPKNVVGTIPIWQDKILLCRRAIEPRSGYWTLPAGFMEIGESPEQGAARETVEEAGVYAKTGELFSMVTSPAGHQVHLFYLAAMPSPEYDIGPETLEAQLFSENEIPWDDIAFRSSYYTLKLFFADRAQGLFSEDHLSGQFRVHTIDLTQSPLHSYAPTITPSP